MASSDDVSAMFASLGVNIPADDHVAPSKERSAIRSVAMLQALMAMSAHVMALDGAVRSLNNAVERIAERVERIEKERASL